MKCKYLDDPTQCTVRVSERDADSLPLSDYKVGDEYILKLYRRDFGGSWYKIVPHKGYGIGGNLNSGVTRYHGWRGTTDGLCVTACGVRQVIKVGPVKRDKDGFDYIKVTVGRDIHPDW